MVTPVSITHQFNGDTAAADLVDAAELDTQLASLASTVNAEIAERQRTIRDGSGLQAQVVRYPALHPEVLTALSGMIYLEDAKVATTANITLSGLQTIDGYLTISGDRVLVIAQTNQVENGVYTALAGAWTRTSDVTGALTTVTAIAVLNGTAYVGTHWRLYANATLGSTTNTWIQIQGFAATVPVSRGGTGANNAASARTNLGLGALAVLATAAQANLASDVLFQVDTIAALKALTAGSHDTVLVRGYYATGDTELRAYRWNGADATADNGGTIIAPTVGAGRWNLQTSGPLSVKWFGAKGDGATNDYAAFVAALSAGSGGLVYVPTPSVGYLIATGTLTVPTNTTLSGVARQATKLLHGFNGDMFNLADGACVQNLFCDGQGATFTGKGFVMAGTDGRQSMTGVRATSFDGAVLDFAVAAGSQSCFVDCRLSRTAAGTGTGRYAVVISATQQLSAVPRKFFGIETDGNCSFDFGGCNDTFIVDSFLSDLNYTVDTRGVNITGTRVANQVALTLRGFNNSIVGCDIAPQITIAVGSDNNTVGPGSFNSLPVIDSSANGRNLVYHWLQTYTPTLTAGGVAPSLGNGTLVAAFCRQGTVVTVTIELTLGSTTTLGTGDLRFSLPTSAPNANAKVQMGGVCQLNPSGAGAGFYTGVMLIPAGTQYASMRRDTSNSVSFNSPGTFQNGDIIRATFQYQV